MNIKLVNKALVPAPAKLGSELPAERMEAADMQEHFSGQVPQRNERPAADVLAEAEAKSAAAVFIP